LLNELAPIFGQKLCCEKVVTEVITLSDDQSFGVRKMVAQNIGTLAKTIGADEFVSSKLVRHFCVKKLF
jgi:hypothetical protein